MPLEQNTLDRQQQMLLQQQQQQQQQQQHYGTYVSAAAAQPWAQPPAQMNMYATMPYQTTTEYVDKTAAATAGYGYAIDPNDFYAAQQRNQQQAYAAYSQMYPQQYGQNYVGQQQAYAQMSDGRDSRGMAAAASFNPGAPPPNFSRPPPQQPAAAATTATAALKRGAAAAYTANWVSSTSSIPPELKDSPEVGAGANSLANARFIGIETAEDTPSYPQHHHSVRQQQQLGQQQQQAAEWAQPATAHNEFGATWGERRDDNVFAQPVGTFDHTQFGRLSLEDVNNQHNAYGLSHAAVASATAAAGADMGQWNQPDKYAQTAHGGHQMHQQSWHTMTGQQQQSQPAQHHPHQQHHHQQQAGGGFQQQHSGGHNGGGTGGYGSAAGQRAGNERKSMQPREERREPLTWEERVKKGSIAKERAEFRNAFGESQTVGQVGGGGGARSEKGGNRVGSGGGSGGMRGGGAGRGGQRSNERMADRDGGWHVGGGGKAEQEGYHANNTHGYSSDVWRGGRGTSNTGNLSGRGGVPRSGGHAHLGGPPPPPPPPPGSLRGRAGLPMMLPRGAGHIPLSGAAFPPGAAPPPPPHFDSLLQQQDQRFKSTWLDANLLMPFPAPPFIHPMAGALAVRGGIRGVGTRGRGGFGSYSSGPRGRGRSLVAASGRGVQNSGGAGGESAEKEGAENVNDEETAENAENVNGEEESKAEDEEEEEQKENKTVDKVSPERASNGEVKCVPETNGEETVSTTQVNGSQ